MTSRPVFVPDAIPATLRDVPRWVAWRYQTRNGEPTKTPYDARSGRLASVNQRGTWSAFADALAACRTADYDGLGFVLNGDGVVALDYDDCIAEDGTIAPDVVADLAALGTYAERSPSGRGVRAFVVGDLPDGATGRRRGGFEVYASARYVTVTGDRIDGMPEAIADRGDALAAIYAARIGNHARGASPPVAANPASLTADDETIVRRLLTIPAAAALYRGDMSRHDGDQSVADSALACYAVYCGAQDAAQLWRVLATSGLARDKWRRDDYRDRTAAFAFSKITDRYTDRTAPALIVEGSPTQPDDAHNFGAHCDDALDELQRLRFELDRTRAERDRAIVERDRARAIADRANETIRGVLTVLGNRRLGAVRVTAAVSVVKFAALGDGMHKVSTREMGEDAGESAAAASRHLRLLEAMPGSPLRREVRRLPGVDVETGEIVGPPRDWTFIGMTTNSVSEYADALAVLAVPESERHGGARQAVAPACEDHPDAGGVLRVAYSLDCAACGRVLQRGERRPARVPPDRLASPVAAALQDETRESPPHPVVDVSLAVQDETREPRADFERAALHDAMRTPPLIPPLPSEIAARYTA